MDKVFQEHPELNVYYKTSDGEKFYLEHNAKLHAKGLQDKTVTPVERGAAVSPEADGQDERLDYREAIKQIKAAESLEDLASFEDYPQKSVQEALAAKVQELTALLEEPNKD